jgi:hypothetical protein
MNDFQVEDLYQFLPIYDNTGYISMLLNALKGNYEQDYFHFAYLAFHMLFMFFLYCAVWRFKLAHPERFRDAMVSISPQDRNTLIESESPFDFSILDESKFVQFLSMLNCGDEFIGKIKKLVRKRNNIAHTNGSFAFSNRNELNFSIHEVKGYILKIQKLSFGTTAECFKNFLSESVDPDKRQFQDISDQIESQFLRKFYISQKDIQMILSSPKRILSTFSISPIFTDVIVELKQY